MHKFKVLSDKTFSEIEEKFKQLEERLSKTEEALSNLENNVTDTSNDIEKLELITTKIEQFNRQMSFTNRRIYLELKKNFVYLIVPVPGYEESCIELSVANISESFEKIERNLDIQLDSIAFYHYFFITSKFDHLLEFNVMPSDEYCALVRFSLENDDEIAVELINGCNIRVNYCKSLNVDASQKLVFEENSKIRFELSILDIVDDYDEYRVKAITSLECRLNDIDDVIKCLKEKIESNEQFKRLSRQSEN